MKLHNQFGRHAAHRPEFFDGVAADEPVDDGRSHLHGGPDLPDVVVADDAARVDPRPAHQLLGEDAVGDRRPHGRVDDALALVQVEVVAGADETKTVVASADSLSGFEPLTIRPDSLFTMIGERTNIQDGSVLHVSHAGDYGPGAALAEIHRVLQTGGRLVLGLGPLAEPGEPADRTSQAIGITVWTEPELRELLADDPTLAGLLRA